MVGLKKIKNLMVMFYTKLKTIYKNMVYNEIMFVEKFKTTFQCNSPEVLLFSAVFM